MRLKCMQMHNPDLARRSPRGGRVLCPEKRTFKTLGHVVANSYHVKLIWHRLCVAWAGGPVVEFRVLVSGSISSGGDHGMHC